MQKEQAEKKAGLKSESFRGVSSCKIFKDLFLWKAAAFMMMLGVFYSTPATGEQSRHVLMDNNKIECEIIVPDKSGTFACFAGDELKEIMSKSFGGDVPLLKSPDGKAKTLIILGDNKELRDLGVDVNNIPRDGFVIKSSGNKIFIAGRDGVNVDARKLMATSEWHKRDTLPERGTLYGVYDFLERFLGVRFYFPGRYGTIIPRHTALAFQPVDLQISPDHTARSMGYSGELYPGFDEDCQDKDINKNTWYYKTLDKLRLRLQTGYIPHCHGLRLYGHITRFAETHPEYFALMGNGKRYNNPKAPHTGQLCFSSGIRDEIYKDAEAYLTGKPAESRGVTPTDRGKYYWSPSSCQPGYFDIMPQDGFFPCNCQECQKYFKGLTFSTMDKKASSEFMWNFFCEIADRLKKNKIPGHITTMAYTPYRDIPSRDIPDNVMVALCPPGPDTKKFDDTLGYIKAWSKKLNGRKVWLWNNFGKTGKLVLPGVPFVVPKATGRYYKAAAPYIYGAFVSLPQDYYLFKYINAYVANKVMWDNSTDVDKLLKEHYRLMFGPAAGTMEKIYERFEEIWLDKICGNEVESSLGMTAAPPSDYDLWEKIYSPREIDYISGLFALAEKESSVSQEHLERVKFMRANLFGPLIKEREAYEKNLNSIADFTAHVPMLPEGERVTVDGNINKKLWQNIKGITLSPMQKGKNIPADIITTVKLLKDKEHLYICFHCKEPEIANEGSSALEKDSSDIFRSSRIEIFLNPSGDRKNYFQLAVTPSGALADNSARKLGASRELNKAWTSEAECAVRRDSNAWTAEISIPFKNLGEWKQDGFPANFNRTRILKTGVVENFSWSPYLGGGDFHGVEKFGTLDFTDPASGNIIKDGTFDFQIKGNKTGAWTIRNNSPEKAKWKIISDDAVEGGKALCLEASGEGASIAMRQYITRLEPETDYILSFFIRTEKLIPSSKGGAFVSFWDEKYKYFPANPYTGTMPWAKQAFSFKTSKNVNNGPVNYMSLVLRGAEGRVCFANIKLKKAEK